MNFTLSDNDTGSNRVQSLEVESVDTLVKIKLFITQQAKSVSFDNDVISFDNDLITWDNI